MIDSREALKKDILDYLTQEAKVDDKALLIKAIDVIKKAALQEFPVDKEMLNDRKIREYCKAIGLKEGDVFYVKISWSFAPRHYATIVQFVKRYEALEEAEWMASEALEEAIEEEIYHQFDPLGDAEYDEIGAPDFAVCVYDDRIEVRAYESGIGEILPKKGRKYIGCQGNIRWQYPLSALAELERFKRPVVKVSELQK